MGLRKDVMVSIECIEKGCTNNYSVGLEDTELLMKNVESTGWIHVETKDAYGSVCPICAPKYKSGREA
jgi:hypothetical protein